MLRCTTCSRHALDHEARCPFCGGELTDRSRSVLGRRLRNTLGAAVTPLVLTACYGVGGLETDSDLPGEDLDEDGYTADVDCDDDDASVHPGAAEICDDGVDNDCDQAVDTADDDCATAGS